MRSVERQLFDRLHDSGRHPEWVSFIHCGGNRSQRDYDCLGDVPGRVPASTATPTAPSARTGATPGSQASGPRTQAPGACAKASGPGTQAPRRRPCGAAPAGAASGRNFDADPDGCSRAHRNAIGDPY